MVHARHLNIEYTRRKVSVPRQRVNAYACARPMASPIAPPSAKSFHSSSLKTECRMSSKSAGGSAAMRSRSVSSRRSACVRWGGGLLPRSLTSPSPSPNPGPGPGPSPSPSPNPTLAQAGRLGHVGLGALHGLGHRWLGSGCGLGSGLGSGFEPGFGLELG